MQLPLAVPQVFCSHGYLPELLNICISFQYDFFSFFGDSIWDLVISLASDHVVGCLTPNLAHLSIQQNEISHSHTFPLIIFAVRWLFYEILLGKVSVQSKGGDVKCWLVLQWQDAGTAVFNVISAHCSCYSPCPRLLLPFLSAFRSRSECLRAFQPNKPTCLCDLRRAFLFTSLLKQIDGDYPPSI